MGILKFIQKGADLNFLNDDGWSSLHVACENGHAGCATILLDHGANMDIQDYNDWNTPLHIVCQYGHEGCVTLLLNHGANMGIQNNKGSTPLHIACQYGKEGCITLLLNHGA